MNWNKCPAVDWFTELIFYKYIPIDINIIKLNHSSQSMSKPPSTITIKKKKDEMMALELTKTTFINFPIDEIRESIR